VTPLGDFFGNSSKAVLLGMKAALGWDRASTQAKLCQLGDLPASF